MKIVNRGFILLKPKANFLEWSNTFCTDDISFSEADDCEGTIYLIEEDFMEFEPVLEKNFKKMFKNELDAVTDEENWPDKLSLELFLEWFEVDFGSSVFDLEKSDLKAEK